MSLRFVSCATLACGTCIVGTCIYQYAVPKTWREILTKEGFRFLESDEEYRAVWADNKEEIIEKIKDKYSELGGATTESTAANAIKNWCYKQLSRYPEPEELEDRKYLVNLCTQSGILKVHGMLLYSKKSGFLSYDGDGDDSRYKNIFAVYRYNERFIAWLNEGGTEVLNDKSKAEDKFSILKTKCKTVLSSKRERETKANNYKYAAWWCSGLDKETVEARIKAKNPDWKQATNWDDVVETWKHTNEVIVAASRTTGSNFVTLNKDKYKSWCEENLKKQLHEDDIYKETYILVMSACKLIVKPPR